MITKHKINMDLTIRSSVPRICVVQGDTGTRAVELCITAGGAPWIPEQVDGAFLRYRGNDGTGGSYDTLPDGQKAWQLEENRLTFLLAPRMMAAPGLVEAQAMVLRGEKTIASFTFQILVEEDVSCGTVEKEDYVNWAAWAQKELDIRLQQAKDSGEFNGVAFVPYVDEQGRLSWTNDRGADNPAPVDVVSMLEAGIRETVLRLSGGTMTGNLDMGGNAVTGLKEPEQASDAVTKDYADKFFRRTVITLPRIMWSNFRIAAQISGVTEDNLVLLSPTPDTLDAYAVAGVRCIEQHDGQLIFSCKTMPSQTVKINAVVFLRGAAE